jgi:hypothetical protein
MAIERPQEGHGALLQSKLQDSIKSWHVILQMVDPLKNA